MELLKVFTAILPVFLIIGMGYVLRWTKVINDESEKSIMRLVINLLYPCFILSKVPGSESLQDPGLVGIAMTVGFLLALTGLAVSYGVGRLWKVSTEQGLNTFCFSTAIQNYGFIPIPLVMALFPNSQDETISVLFVHNLGLEIAMWTIGVVILSGTFTGSLKRLINGPTIAIAIGLLLNFSGLHTWVPGFVNLAISDLGVCSIPISLLVVGATLASVIEHEQWETKWNVIAGSIMVRFAIMPAVLLSVASLVFSVSPNLQRVLIIESAMPAAVFPIMLAKYYGGKSGVAVQIVVATSVLSLLMTPVLLTFGMKLLEVAYD